MNSEETSMQSLNELRNLIRSVIQEELDDMDEASQAAKDAKAQGLTNMGFGRWGKDGKVTHKSDNGKLVKFSRAGMERQTGLKFGRGAEKDILRKGNVPQAKMTEPGKLQRIQPKVTPDTNRKRNAPQDSMQKGNSATRLIRKMDDRVFHNGSVYDTIQSTAKSDDPTMTGNDFRKLTGFNNTQMTAYTKLHDRDKSMPLFRYNPASDTVSFNDTDWYADDWD